MINVEADSGGPNHQTIYATWVDQVVEHVGLGHESIGVAQSFSYEADEVDIASLRSISHSKPYGATHIVLYA